jgi:hypothetical protein
MPSQSEKPHKDPEWDARTLCSDEGCIGVIGPEGRCLECGRPYEGDLPGGLAASATTDKSEAGNDRDISSADSEASPTDESLPLDNEWEARELCPDESCIGVIGPEGRCLECGRPAQGD